MSSLALLELGVELLALLPLFHLAGLVLAYRAIVHTRTAQGAIAWVVSLLLMPYLAVPLYAVFGRRKFRGYMAARRAGDSLLSGIARELQEHEEAHRSRFEPERPELAAAEQLAKLPFVAGNAAELLVDGEAIFASILEAVRGAREYILAQFYIVRDDGIGRELQALLVERAREGVRVYFLYDGIGCYSLPEAYLDTLREAGQTMIIVEQSLNVALAISDRAVFLEKGQVRFEGSAKELAERDDLARAVFLGREGG